MAISTERPLKRTDTVQTMYAFGFLLTWLITYALVGAYEKGDVVAWHGFEGSKAWETYKSILGPRVQIVSDGKGGQALRMERKSDTDASTMIDFPLPVEALRGAKIQVKVSVKSEYVSKAPAMWNGIKVMLNIEAPSGGSWPQANLPQGSFDWRISNFVARIPADAQRAVVSLGLESVTGSVLFDDVVVTIARTVTVRPKTPPSGPRYTGHKFDRLRGTMIGLNPNEEDLRDLASWKANHVRWQLVWEGFPHSPADNGEVSAYEIWLEGALQHLDRMLPLCRELGLTITLDLHTPPGGRNEQHQMYMFQQKRYQDAFLNVWEKLARRYRYESQISSYDLLNEPVDENVGEGLLDWRDLLEVVVNRIRVIDPDRTLVVEGAPWGGPAPLADFDPLSDKKVVYSLHMYEPMEFTHQNVYTQVTPITYPGKMSDNKWWDKEALRRVLQPVIDWQRAYNAHVYVGEFSAIRWAPGESAHAWMRDAIELFEEYKWDWCYHAFREWDGWSVEHVGNRTNTQVATTPTQRQYLLWWWFGHNKK